MPNTPVQPTKGAENYTVKSKYNVYSVCQFVSNKSLVLGKRTKEK